MTNLNIAARTFRLQVYNESDVPEIFPVQAFELTTESFQYESPPFRSASFLIQSNNPAESLDPEINPTRFNFSHKVVPEFLLDDGVTWHPLYTGFVERMLPNDGRVEASEGGERRRVRSLRLDIVDLIQESSYYEPPLDASGITLGTVTPFNTVTNLYLAGIGAPNITEIPSTPDFPLTIDVPFPLNEPDKASRIQKIHRCYFANPLNRKEFQYIYNDELGNVRRSAINLAPTTFLIDGSAGDVVDYINSDQPRERPPGNITVSGNVRKALAKAPTVSPAPSPSKGPLRLPVLPDVPGASPDNTNYFDHNEVILFKSSATIQISATGINPGYLLIPGWRSTVTEEEPAGVVFKDLPAFNSIGGSINLERRTPTLFLNRQITHDKIYGGPDGRITRDETITTQPTAVVEIPENDANVSLRTETEKIVIEYEFYLDGILKKKTTTTSRTRGSINQSQNEQIFTTLLTELVVVRVETEEWVRHTGTKDTYTWVPSETVYYGEPNRQPTETGNAESEPPEVEFFPGMFEESGDDVTCTFPFAYGSTKQPKEDLSLDYGSNLLSAGYCNNLAEIEAILIHGQSLARKLKFEVTDGIIQGLRPAGGEPNPYARILDPDDGITRVYLLDDIEIFADHTQCYGTATGLFLGIVNTVTSAIEPLVKRVPSLRVIAPNEPRVIAPNEPRIVA